MKFAKIGATLFVLWGLLHVVGGSMILLAVADGAADGYALYEVSAAPYTELAGRVLAYLAFSFVWIGAAVSWIGFRYNWRNSPDALALNTALVGLTDLGLVLFLILPGYVSWAEASPGLVLFAGAVIIGGIACQSAGKPVAAT